MRMRSTGLGKTELEGDIAKLEVVDDLLILHVHTTKPVRWHVRTAIQHKDILRLAGLLFTPAVLRYLWRARSKSSKEPESF